MVLQLKSSATFFGTGGEMKINSNQFYCAWWNNSHESDVWLSEKGNAEAWGPAQLSYHAGHFFGGGGRNKQNKTRMVTVQKEPTSCTEHLPHVCLFFVQINNNSPQFQIYQRPQTSTLSSCSRQHRDSHGIWAEGPVVMHNTDCRNTAALPLVQLCCP